MTALPAAGFRFAGWEGVTGIDAANPELVLTTGDDVIITARFATAAAGTPVIINEINYNSQADFDSGDWIELYNPLSGQVDLSGWTLTDADINAGLSIPAGTVLAPQGYLVICRDLSAFQQFWPGITTAIGGLPFGLNNSGEYLCLYDHAAALIDSLTFSNSTPWPRQPDGSGATLALRDPILDNGLACNWMPSFAHGTPGAVNVSMSRIEDEPPVPVAYSLDIFPNPFNAVTTILVQPGSADRFRVAVYDLLGRQVTVLYNGKSNAEQYTLHWDGRSINGEPSASGVYLVVLNTDKARQVSKILLLK